MENNRKNIVIIGIINSQIVLVKMIELQIDGKGGGNSFS